jgi:hypothetical protein
VPRRARLVAGGFFTALLLQLWVNASVLDWWSGASFGQRRMCSATLILVFGLAALLSAANRWSRRLPLSARRIAGAAVLSWFVAWNIGLIVDLRSRQASANSAVRPMCCAGIPRPMGWIARPIYRAVGNPFALPASLATSLRHGVPLRSWDLLVGRYADMPELKDLNEDLHWKRRHSWNLAAGGHQPYLVRGFGPAQKDGKTVYRWTVADEAVALVPLYMDGARIITVSVRPSTGPDGEPMTVELGWNGQVYARQPLEPGWQRVELHVPGSAVRAGLNQLFIRAAPRPTAPGPGALEPPPDGRRAGVAISKLQLSYPAR